MEITVKIKHVYGNRLIYPVCDKAKAFAALSGTTTLTSRAVQMIKSLGFTIKIKQEQL